LGSVGGGLWGFDKLSVFDEESSLEAIGWGTQEAPSGAIGMYQRVLEVFVSGGMWG